MKQNLKREELKYLRLEKKMELSEMIKVMQHYDNGVEIEFFSNRV